MRSAKDTEGREYTWELMGVDIKGETERYVEARLKKCLKSHQAENSELSHSDLRASPGLLIRVTG